MNSRQKGAVGERELSRILREYGYNTRRGQQYSGANGDADVVGLPGIHIECKRVERLNISEAMNQSIKDARPGEMPAVFHRKNCEPWKTTVLTDDFMKLYGNQREKWIWCKDRLPEKQGDEYPHVIAFSDCIDGWEMHIAVYGFFGGDEWGEAYDPAEAIFDVVAWMPLPTPPEEYHE